MHWPIPVVDYAFFSRQVLPGPRCLRTLARAVESARQRDEAAVSDTTDQQYYNLQVSMFIAGSPHQTTWQNQNSCSTGVHTSFEKPSWFAQGCTGDRFVGDTKRPHPAVHGPNSELLRQGRCTYAWISFGATKFENAQELNIPPGREKIVLCAPFWVEHATNPTRLAGNGSRYPPNPWTKTKNPRMSRKSSLPTMLCEPQLQSDGSKSRQPYALNIPTHP